MARSAILNVMVAAAMKAARGLNRDFGEVENLQVSRKGPADFVSAADRRAEELIKAELQRARPRYGFLMEESGETKGDDPQHRWIVDPLDGTTNFLHGIPQFAISIALERQGKLAAAVIYDPIADELFTAERGGGAYLNDRRLRVAARQNLADCLIATGMPFKAHGDAALFLRELALLMPQVAGIRRFGAASLDLAWVAAGRFDGFWERELSPWDLAAGILLVREAGGFATDLAGGDSMLESGGIVAGNESVHSQLLAHLRG
jgi:myo-inositol-1(or 4)-monophosphatase